jgi:hypothetical protein
MWLAGAPEYIFGLSLGVVALIISCLLLIPPHPSPVFERRATPPPSRSPLPEAPAIEPYDDDEIVSAMKAIYDSLIQLDQITPDQLVYPPASGHTINTELCKPLNLDSCVISLMKRLPYPESIQDSLHFNFIEDSRALVYIEDEDSRLDAILKMGAFPKL